MSTNGGNVVSGGIETSYLPKNVAKDELARRDPERRSKVLTVCRIERDHGDEDGRARTEVLMALGLYDVAIAMKHGVSSPDLMPAPVTLMAVDPVNGSIPSREQKAINHGTAGGFRAHKRRSETPCEACTVAATEAGQAFAAKNPNRGTKS